MNKKHASLIGLIVVAVVLLGFGSFFLLQKTQSPIITKESKDEFTGTWHGGGTTKDGYNWFVDYTFKNARLPDGQGTYDMKTDSSFKDNGTYEIVKRFDDHVSVQMRKTSIPFNKTYDIYISMAPDQQSITIDGMKLVKVK